jgi:FkbM family methyltransferase
MKKGIRELILKMTPAAVRNFYHYNHTEYKDNQSGVVSFSQSGEDMILRIIFGSRTEGIFVDIGAHHPTLYSNTKFFAQRGWTGINIEPMPGTKAVFDAERPGDTNLELLISETEGEVEFYLFDPPLMNTMSKEQVKENEKFEWCTYKGSVKVPSLPLGNVLDKYLPPGKKIDFMSIDVEGAEMTVLRSNDWLKYAPDVILVEMIDRRFEEVFDTEVHRFLTEKSYNCFGKNWNTLFYKKEGFFEFS